MAIILVLTAVAIPAVNQGIQAYRMSGAATDLANILERTRYEAIRRNTTVSCRYVLVGGRSLVYIDLNNNSTADRTEPQVVFPQEAQILPAGVAPAPSSMGAAYANAVIPPTPAITFDSRGTVFYGANPTAVYVIYLGQTALANKNGYRAVTVTPTGRTKVWSAAKYGAWATN